MDRRKPSSFINGKILKRILKNIIAGNEEKDWTVSNFERLHLGGIKKNDLRVRAKNDEPPVALITVQVGE